MKCNHIKSRLIGFIDGDLYPADHREIETHLRYCDSCHQEWLAMKALSDTTSEFIVYQDAPYPYAALRPRMAVISPLEEIMAFFPRMRAQGLAGRLATVLSLLFLFSLPFPGRLVRDLTEPARRTLAEEIAKWEEPYQEQLDEEYREQLKSRLRATNG